MDVSAALEAHKSKFKPTTVDKDVPVDFDLHHLAAFDNNALDEKKLKSSKVNDYLQDLARDTTQLLLNAIFTLPTKSSDEGVTAVLPVHATFALPREKPLPTPKPKTRWEKFAEAKGIQKKPRKDRMAVDEATGEYKPTYGYGRVRDEDGDERDWLLEVPQNADPMEDQYAKKREERKERAEKNKKKQVRNQEEAAAASGQDLVTKAAKMGVVGKVGKQPKETPGLAPERARKTAALERSLKISKTSTASIGKFDRRLEEDAKLKTPGVRRQFEPVVAASTAGSKKRKSDDDGSSHDAKELATEKATAMSILDKVVSKDDVLNVRKAIKVTKRRS